MAKKGTAQDVVSLLQEHGMTLTTAESLTGGLAAARITEVPGASRVFRQGFVTYCNRAKRTLLGVKKSTLKKHGAVSCQTAKQMAVNGALYADADVCISFTGNAGPSAKEDKPVGLAYIGCCCRGAVVVKECHFKGDRAQIRESCVKTAFQLIRACVEQQEKT